MKVLILHLISNEEIRINADKIESYGTITDNTFGNGTYNGETYILTGLPDEEAYIVQETPEQIDIMIRDKSVVSRWRK